MIDVPWKVRNPTAAMMPIAPAAYGSAKVSWRIVPAAAAMTARMRSSMAT